MNRNNFGGSSGKATPAENLLSTDPSLRNKEKVISLEFSMPQKTMEVVPGVDFIERNRVIKGDTLSIKNKLRLSEYRRF